MKIINKNNGNEIKIIICDGDGTLVGNKKHNSSYTFIAECFGKQDILNATEKKFRERYNKATPELREEILKEWVVNDIGVFKGSNINEINMDRIPYSTGVLTFFEKIRDATTTKIILSAGPHFIYDNVKERLRMDECISNIYKYDEGILTGEFVLKVGANDKLPIVKNMLRSRNIKPHNVCFVGNDHNDTHVMQYIKDNEGLSIAMKPIDETVIEASNLVVEDFRKILEHIELD